MIVAEELQVNLCQDIDMGVLCISVSKDEDDTVDCQQQDCRVERITMIAEDGKA